MENLLFALIATVPVVTAAAPEAHSCAPASLELTSQREMKIPEIEAENMRIIAQRRMIDSDIPNQPFGFANSRWLAFKELVKSGDKIVEYSNGERAWQNQAGESGYALIRSGCIVKIFVTLRN